MRRPATDQVSAVPGDKKDENLHLWSRFSSQMSLSQITCRLNVACDISMRKRRRLRYGQELRRRRTPPRSVTTDLAAVCDIRRSAWPAGRDGVAGDRRRSRCSARACRRGCPAPGRAGMRGPPAARRRSSMNGPTSTWPAGRSRRPGRPDPVGAETMSPHANWHIRGSGRRAVLGAGRGQPQLRRGLEIYETCLSGSCSGWAGSGRCRPGSRGCS
jgi:hypothetical protein